MAPDDTSLKILRHPSRGISTSYAMLGCLVVPSDYAGEAKKRRNLPVSYHELAQTPTHVIVLGDAGRLKENLRYAEIG
jgi:hypothetical protein